MRKLTLLFCFCATHASAQERCTLGVDVPERVALQGVVVLVLVEPQCFGVYENGTLSTRFVHRQLYGYASTGRDGKETPLTNPQTGPHRINRVEGREYTSKEITIRVRGRDVPAPMPYPLFFDDRGRAIHAGQTGEEYASSGCVRIPYAAARALNLGFDHSKIQVVITRNRTTWRTDWEKR